MDNSDWVGPSQQLITKQFWGLFTVVSPICHQGKGQGLLGEKAVSSLPPPRKASNYPVSCPLFASLQVFFSFFFFNETKFCLHPTALSHESPCRQPVYLHESPCRQPDCLGPQGILLFPLALPNFLSYQGHKLFTARST